MRYIVQKIIITLLLALLFNCWKKQDHDITRPIVPHYILNGTAVDYDTGESLSNIVIELKASKMLYDVVFETQYDTTDSSGSFSFDPVYPGYYKWSIKRDSCWLAEKRLQIQHRDSTTIIPVPKIFFAKVFSYSSTGNPAFAINGTKAWLNEYGMTPSSKKSQMFLVYKLTREIGWIQEKYYISTLDKKNVTSMAFGREALYACIAPDTLYIINTFDGQVTGKYQLSQNITAVAFHAPQNCMYTCSKNNIYRHETGQPLNIAQSWNFENFTLSAITYYKTIYTYDNNAFLLRKHDTEMNVITTYALINSLTQNQILEIYDMGFDGYGQLWYSYLL